MTLLSGWCIDEKASRHLDHPEMAQKFHDKCTRKECPCPNHQRKAPAKKLSSEDYL